MQLFREFLPLPIADKWLLAKAVFLLETIKLSMRLLPFQAFLRLWSRVARMSTRRPRCAGHASTDRVAWAVEVASQHTFGAKTCLNQALATQMLLVRRGYPALLHIGVAKGKEGQFQAHAWVESEGKVVIGGLGLECFTPLAVFEEKGLKDFRAKKAPTWAMTTSKCLPKEKA